MPYNARGALGNQGCNVAEVVIVRSGAGLRPLKIDPQQGPMGIPARGRQHQELASLGSGLIDRAKRQRLALKLSLSHSELRPDIGSSSYRT